VPKVFGDARGYFFESYSERDFAAAGIADVFGAMGSWDDEPPSMAQEMGLGGEYDRLSDELLAQKNLAILFAINGN